MLMQNTLFRTCLFAVAASLAGCGPSESLTDPGPDVPDDPNPPPPVTLPLRTDLGTFGGQSSFAYDVNDAGVVVGAAQTATGTFEAFRWTLDGGLQALPPLTGDLESRAIAVANDNTVLGVSISEGGAARPVTWTGTDAPVELPIPPIAGAGLTPNDRSPQGTVVGDAIFTDDPSEVHAWVWSPAGGMTDLGSQLEVQFENYAAAINDAGQVVGTLGGGLWRAYLWRAQDGARSLGVPGTLTDRTEVTAQGINRDGRVVGWARLLSSGEDDDAPVEPFPTFGSYAYVWSDASGFTLLPGFGGESESDAVGDDVNDRGDVVGSATPPGASAIKAVAWPRGGAIVDLNGSDANPSVALAVSNTGIAAGWTSTDGGVGTNRATVWNLDRTTAVTTRIKGATPQRGRTRLAVTPTRGAAQCLRLRTRIVSKTGLADCFEGRAGGLARTRADQ
jgi:probable HAF family extracellular repeat protein